MANNMKQKFVSQKIFNDIMAELPPKLQKTAELEDDKSIAGWFMGASGENLEKVKELVSGVIDLTLAGRKNLFPEDPEYITDEVKASTAYKNALQEVESKSNKLQEILIKYSVPFSSLRYQGHMTWDITLPSILGYISGMLQNQNNVSSQASPATTLYEIAACNDIARMTGFKVRPLEEQASSSDEIFAWSHITSGGTVANIESVWAARELKFMPLGIRCATENGQSFEAIRDGLTLPNGSPYKDATVWQLLNLKQDDTLSLPAQIADLMGDEVDESAVWKLLGEHYSLNAKGLNFFYKHYLLPEDIKAPAIIVPSTKHYSWVKSTSLLGMGGGQQGLTEDELTDMSKIQDDGLLNIYVDDEGKVKTDLLRKVLESCKTHKKPIVLNVAVVGTTEEGAVDPVEDLLALREEFRNQPEEPFDYSIHTDAAWGGYFTACIRNPFELELFPEDEDLTIDGMFDNGESWFRDSVYQSMTHIHKCDSVTIDPHKMGYIPYPAGSLTYRNDNIINLLSFSAPYISSEGDSSEINTRNIGDSGIEGSKPGAAATSVFLSHQVIRPDKRGYGKIINQSMLNAKLFYLYLVTLGHAFPEDKFNIVMLTPLSKELEGKIEALSKILWEQKILQTELYCHKDVACFLRKISGDQNIVDYVFTNKADNSQLVTEELNNQLFQNLSVQSGEPIGKDQIFVSMTTFGRSNYGDDFIDALGERLYSNPKEVDEIPCIRSVVLDPWAIYTQGQDGMFNFFTDVFIPKLRKEVNLLCQVVA